MENLKTDSAIIINGSAHGSQDIKDLSAHIEKAQTFFFKRNIDGQTLGINLYFLEFVNMDNDQKKDFLSLSAEYPLLEAYFQSLELQKESKKKLMTAHQLMQKVQNFMSTPLEERKYLYQEFVLLEKLRKDVDLNIDTESYPKEIATKNWNCGQKFIYYRDCAVDFLSMGRKFNQEYLTALRLETKLSVERHKAVSKQIITAVTDAKADSKTIRIHIQFGTGHVPGLLRILRTSLSNIAPNIPITTSYEHGKFYLHNYELISKMEENSKYIPDTKQLTIALLDDIFGNATELQHHPLVNSLTSTQKRQLIYSSLAKCTQKDIDKILKGIISNGFARGLTVLLQH